MVGLANPEDSGKIIQLSGLFLVKASQVTLQ